MIRRFTIALAVSTASLLAEESGDLMRFTNGDQFHGVFNGVSVGPKINWRRDDMNTDVQFDTMKVRQIVLRKGRPETSLTSLSHVALVQGDRFPGTISALDEKHITLDTEYAGQLKIPRELVGMVAPNPFGGRILYQGPYADDEWQSLDTLEPDEEPADDEEISKWNFAGAAWYWQSQKAGTALVRKEGMPDRSILRCQLAWKTRLSLAIAFHADFSRPERENLEEDEDANPRRFPAGDTAIFPELFGNSYVLHLYSNYVMLYRSSFNETGNPVLERVQANHNNIRLGETGSATVEIRSDRSTGEISLFINDEYIVQWSEPVNDPKNSGYAGKGPGYGFLVQTESSPVRISDIVLAEWNGMPDSARSLQVEEQDIVLLANGTDRFSGKIVGLEDEKFLLEGKYGKFQFPVTDVAEIRFAKRSLAKPDPEATSPLRIRLHPVGLVSGTPLSGTHGEMRLTSPGIGEWNLKLDSAVLLDFQSTTSFLDEWDPEF